MTTLEIIKQALQSGVKCDCMKTQSTKGIAVYPFNNNAKRFDVPCIEINDSVGKFGTFQANVNVIVNRKINNIGEVFCCLNQVRDVKVGNTKVTIEIPDLEQSSVDDTIFIYTGIAIIKLK